MNRFHSSGTASGNVEVMWTWKMIMPTTAIVHSVPPRRDEQQQRQRELHRRCRGARPAPPAADGLQVLGVVAIEPALGRRASGSTGVLLIITATTNGKCLFSFEAAAPHQMQTSTSCEATNRFRSGTGRRSAAARRVSGRALRNETLSRKPEQHEEREQHADRAVVSRRPGGEARRRRVPCDTSRNTPTRARPRTAPRRAACAAIRVSAGRARETAAGGSCPGAASRGCRRSAAMKRNVSGIDPGAQTDELPEHRPHDDLLEDDRFRPPAAEVAEPAEAAARRGDHERAAEREDHELDDVQQVDGVGTPTPLSAQSCASGLIRSSSGQALPLLDIDRRCGRSDESHTFPCPCLPASRRPPRPAP